MLPHSDTTPDAEVVQSALWRQMTPEQRLRTVFLASEFERELAVANILREHPGWTVLEAQWEFLRQRYPADPIPEKPPQHAIDRARTEERKQRHRGRRDDIG